MDSQATALRSHTCGALRLNHAGQQVHLCGWVQRTRDFGKFLFLDLRDRFGITQVAFNADEADLYKRAKELGRETVVRISGAVRERENKNPKLDTGDIEIIPATLEVLGPAKLPPFLIEDETDGHEDLRLQYRYLDIRRPVMTRALLLRAKLMKVVRRFLDSSGFTEIETPNLIKSTPEGARDFLVPSRLHEGQFYALPQSPQILKQLLMVAGMDRYYQICKCYRDEDFRGDRQPEFTQIDCEMAFVSQEDVLQTFEGLVKEVFRETIGHEVAGIQRLTYAECMEKYGTDKPDLRFGMPIVELNGVVSGAGFKVFDDALAEGGLVAGILAEGCAGYSRKDIDKLTDFVKAPHRGAKGLVWVRWNEDGSIKSAVDKFYDETRLKAILEAAGGKPGDLLLMVAASKKVTRRSLGELRLEIAQREGLRKEGEWAILYVVDFPLFEDDEESGAIIPIHHPFVAPNPEDLELMHTKPLEARAWCYDLVINGNELMSGSIRIHNRELQEKIFGILGLSNEERDEKFGFLLKAFEYGAPPHGGCAFGLDRWAMLLSGGQTIRDVIAFPKTSGGRDAMLDAPSTVADDALTALGIKLK